MVAGDFSGDGHLDLAVADGRGRRGRDFPQSKGNGTLCRIVVDRFDQQTQPPWRVADLNGDGNRPDLAVASSGSGRSGPARGLKATTNSLPLPYQLPVGPGCSDVIAANLSGSSMSRPGRGQPDDGHDLGLQHFDGFGLPAPADTSRPGQDVRKTVVAADFNGDGKLDLAAVNYGSNDVSVFARRWPDGNFGAATNLRDRLPGRSSLATADFNSDSRADLVTADFIGLTVSVLREQRRRARFRQPAGSHSPSAGPEDVVVADLTGQRNRRSGRPGSAGLNEVSDLSRSRRWHVPRSDRYVSAGSGPEDVTVGDFTGRWHR